MNWHPPAKQTGSYDLSTFRGHSRAQERFGHLPFTCQREIGETPEPHPIGHIDIRFQPVLELDKVPRCYPAVSESLQQVFHDPGRGGLRVLTTLELFVKDYALDLS